jgi:hypothetical protein
MDPNSAGASLFDPGSFNAYAYVNNKPTAFIDIDGRFPFPVITGGVGAVVGGLVGGGAEAIKQYVQTGSVTSWGKVGTAAGGGALAGAITGATLGIGTEAGLAVVAWQAAGASAAGSTIGGIAQRSADEAWGYARPNSVGEELTSVAQDVVLGGALGYAGGKVADKLFPIPNLKQEIKWIKVALHPRHKRPAAISDAKDNARLQAGFNAAVGGFAGGIPSELGKVIWNWALNYFSNAAHAAETQQPKQKEPNTKICYVGFHCTVQ